MEKKIKIVIGANFGDEGKGLITDYFAAKALANKEAPLVILHNGGAQRGHTVVLPDGVRHVYHHFGCGYGLGVDTYLDRPFIVNPIIYNREKKELDRKFKNNKSVTYVNGGCRVTTPIDMIINQIVEETRDKDRHGSCGLGIFETIKRDGNIYRLTIKDLVWGDHCKIYMDLLKLIDTYLSNRLRDLGITNIPVKWIETLHNLPDILKKWFDDCNEMLKTIEVTNDNIIERYDTLIFEGAQGLLLDRDNKEYFPHLTPSFTGLGYITNMYKDSLAKVDTEICFVTRTYLTRHGAGPLPNECKKEDINATMIDLTNVPNEYQGTLRYGFIRDWKKFRDRCYEEINKYNLDKYFNINITFALTHMNEYLPIGKNFMDSLEDEYIVYTSDGLTRESVKEC